MKHTNDKEYIPFTVIVELATNRAVRVVIIDPDRLDDNDPHLWNARWIPRSVLEDGDLVEIGDDEISVAKWWAEKEGIA